MTRVYTLIAAVATIAGVVLSGCDGKVLVEPELTDTQVRIGGIAGSESRGWQGAARYELRVEEEEGPLFLIRITPEEPSNEELVLVGRGVPELRTYRFDPLESEAGAYLGLVTEAGEKDPFLSDEGLFVLTQVTEGSISGSFSLVAARFFEEDVALAASGAFVASRGPVEFAR